MKGKLYGKTLAELAVIAAETEMPRHAARQMAAWLYRRNSVDIGDWSDISAVRREALAERFEVGVSAPLRESVSADGTKKYLFRVGDGLAGGGVSVETSKNESMCSVGEGGVAEKSTNREHGAETGRMKSALNGAGSHPAQPAVKTADALRETFIESAMIPDNGRDGERATLCVSSQAGCRMGCAFCATGRQGLSRNLTAGEILNQFAALPERDALTNIVYMGMGEPLDNTDEVLRSLEILTSEWGYGWSPTRITLSTAGILPAMERFLAESRVHLAVSLHNPFGDERARIMPVERAYPIQEVVRTLRRHDFSGQRRVSFEYIVMSGLNDSPRHVAGLTKLLGGLSCRLNLIKFHKVPGSPFFSPPRAAMERFRDTLTRKGIRTTIRTSRGEDIEAACGLLSTKERG